MIIHIVQKGETIESIASKYGISVEKLLQENDIPPYLSIGQSIVIVTPDELHRVKEGDSVYEIAKQYQTSMNEIYANNPYLLERDYIYPGDEIVITYPRKGKIVTHGNTVAYIDRSTLIQTLPYLTYLSILNYTATKKGEIVTYYDDSEVIQLAKEYRVVPLMLLTTLSIHGEADLRTDFDLILNEEIQRKQIDNLIAILKSKGYLGVNISFQYISESNLTYFEKYFAKVTRRLNEEGYEVFATINPNITREQERVDFEKINYSKFYQLAYNLIFMTYEWAAQSHPPAPISSIANTEAFLQYVLKFIPSDKIILGIATLGYDWELPYSPGVSRVTYANYKNLISIAYLNNAEIKLDEASKSPYFRYKKGDRVEHIVWFIDAQTIQASLDLIDKYQLKGISIWNITIFNAQLWLMVNSQYTIEKFL